MGKPGFPIPLRGGGVGKPGFPTPLLQRPMFTLGEGDTRSNPPRARSVRNGLFLWYQHTTRYRPRKDPGIGKCQCLEA